MHTWELPRQGQPKFNCDAAYSVARHSGQIAFIDRVWKGEVVHVSSARMRCSSAATAEAITIREAIRFVVDHDITDAVIESDTKTVVQVINDKPAAVNWEYASVIEEILTLLTSSSHRQILFKFVHRQANVVADWLSKSQC